MLKTPITAYAGECYQITPMPSKVETGTYEVISINALDDKVSKDLLLSIKVFITSKFNADGILLTYWLDGDNLGRFCNL